MSDVLTVQGAAGVALACFVTATRTDGGSFVKLADGSPGWVSDLVYVAHEGDLPDDRKYRTIRGALEVLADGGDEDDAGEFADGCVDCYTGQLLDWLGSGCGRVLLCDDAAEELGAPMPDTLTNRIMAGQYFEASRIFALVVAGLGEVVETWEDEADAQTWDGLNGPDGVAVMPGEGVPYELREVGGAYDGHTVTSDSDNGL